MALSLFKLESELAKIMDSESLNFGGYPEDVLESSNRFGQSLFEYATDIIPASTTTEISKQNFVSIFSLSNLQAQNGILQLQLAIQAFALQLSFGMAPTFSGLPPALPINLSEVVQLGLSGASGSECSFKMATLIDTWFRTGTATNNNTAVTINWL